MSNEDNSPPPVVLDNGTGYVKCGFASAEESPPIVFPSCVGRRVVRFEEALGVILLCRLREQRTRRGRSRLHRQPPNYEISYPIKNGIVTSWPDMILVWEHAIYDELKLTREEIGERNDFAHRGASKSDKKIEKNGGDYVYTFRV